MIHSFGELPRSIQITKLVTQNLAFRYNIPEGQLAKKNYTKTQ
jgi:hypothetical protein